MKDLAEHYEEQLDKAAAEIERLREALAPFAHCVHNDNGEVTVTTSDIKPYDYFRAYRALRPHEQSMPPTKADPAIRTYNLTAEETSQDVVIVDTSETHKQRGKT